MNNIVARLGVKNDVMCTLNLKRITLISLGGYEYLLQCKIEKTKYWYMRGINKIINLRIENKVEE